MTIHKQINRRLPYKKTKFLQIGRLATIGIFTHYRHVFLTQGRARKRSFSAGGVKTGPLAGSISVGKDIEQAGMDVVKPAV